MASQVTFFHLMQDLFWKLQENILEEHDIDALVSFIRSTKRFTQFVKVKEFEAAWAQWQGSRYSVYVNSGSSANLIMMNLMKQRGNWQNGDEVIVPAVTWVTNISPVMQCGLRPVFVDINLEDFSFDYEALARAITPRTKAIFVTHLIGFPADMDRINAIAKAHGIEVMEDCCESHGATWNGKKVGNFSSCASFSFYWGHHMTTVEGGMIVTDNEHIYEMAVLKRSHGLARELPESMQRKYRDQYPEIDFNFLFLTDGFNFRNTELHAAIGIAQIAHLDTYIEKRRKNHEEFLKIIEPYSAYLRQPSHKGISSFCLPFLCATPSLKQALQGALSQAGIESRPVISGNLLRQPFLRHAGEYKQFPNADFLHTNAFYIGNNQFVDSGRLQRLSDLLVRFFETRASQV